MMVLSTGNVVKIARSFNNPKEVAFYLQAVVVAFSPANYNKNYCVKLRFHKKALGYVDYIIRNLYNLGVRFKEVVPLPEGIETGRGIILDNCYELTLTKLRILEEEDESSYTEEYEQKVRAALDKIRATWNEPK